jgi:hypothetical protein
MAEAKTSPRPLLPPTPELKAMGSKLSVAFDASDVSIPPPVQHIVAAYAVPRRMNAFSHSFFRAH